VYGLRRFAASIAGRLLCFLQLRNCKMPANAIGTFAVPLLTLQN
jgi:hypothetical protein